MLVLFLYLLSSSLCVATANAIHHFFPKSKAIVDIIHHFTPPLRDVYLSDALVLVQTITAVILIDSRTLLEMFLVMSIAQLCRVACMFSTILPPLKGYEDKYRLGGVNGSGTEYIFSGHACYASVSAIYLYTHEFINLPSILIYNLLSQFLIIATRNHYTVDIILAWIIVSLIYGNVRFCMSTPECAQQLSFLF